MTLMTFDAVSESFPGPKWHRRWRRSWPAYEAWFVARGGDDGPDRKSCRAALSRHMPELVPVYDRLVAIAGGGDRPARFLSTWCPPTYLGGCSLAACADETEVRLVRNYDLSPDLNEGLLLRSEWSGRAVMGMVEFLWGVSDGINDAGLAVALAYGGRSETAKGFGITTILRYVLETCTTVNEGVAVLSRVPSHMAYNVVLADRQGRTASVELSPGGGARRMPHAIATNHQSSAPPPDRAGFTQSYERQTLLRELGIAPSDLYRHFLEFPLRQDRFEAGFGTLFTAEYDPVRIAMRLIWPDQEWAQSLHAFEESRRIVNLLASVPKEVVAFLAAGRPGKFGTAAAPDWSLVMHVDWLVVARDYAAGQGREIPAYLADISARDQIRFSHHYRSRDHLPRSSS
jgi:predicted choloylglycine hydrolase